MSSGIGRQTLYKTPARLKNKVAKMEYIYQGNDEYLNIKTNLPVLWPADNFFSLIAKLNVVR